MEQRTQKYYFNSNVSFRIKSQLFNANHELLATTKSHNFRDFWTSYFGWLYNPAEKISYQIGVHSLQINSKARALSQYFEIFFDDKLVSTIQRGKFKSTQAYLITYKGSDLTMDAYNHGGYINLYKDADQSQRIGLAKRAKETMDEYGIVLNHVEPEDELPLLGVMMCLLVAYRN